MKNPRLEESQPSLLTVRHLFARVAVIERQVAIVNFERQEAKGSLHESSGGVVLVSRIPAAAVRTAALILRGDEMLAHLFVPFLPRLAAEVVHHLRGV